VAVVPSYINVFNDIRNTLDEHLLNKEIYEGMLVSATILRFMKMTDSFLRRANFYFPQRDVITMGNMLNDIINKSLDELIRVGLRPPSEPIPYGMKWVYDFDRRAWYYWSDVDRFFKYNTGLWVRENGTETSKEEEKALRRIRKEMRSGMMQLTATLDED
jgi:hypothetical protein